MTSHSELRAIRKPRPLDALPVDVNAVSAAQILHLSFGATDLEKRVLSRDLDVIEIDVALGAPDEHARLSQRNHLTGIPSVKNHEREGLSLGEPPARRAPSFERGRRSRLAKRLREAGQIGRMLAARTGCGQPLRASRLAYELATLGTGKAHGNKIIVRTEFRECQSRPTVLF